MKELSIHLISVICIDFSLGHHTWQKCKMTIKLFNKLNNFFIALQKIQVAHLAIGLYLYFIKLEKQESRNLIRPTMLSLKHLVHVAKIGPDRFCA